MTNLEYGLKHGLISYSVNDLFGWIDIRIQDVYPSSEEDVKKIIETLAKEHKTK